ncbi:DUF6169 family protein [Flavobacterium sp. WC2429]|uniref:DUF6169 family protein n=1 Tax=Flavobacterium sp. WC2429 TaxID=3234140 RepID=A0AB39WK17_9FLAO
MQNLYNYTFDEITSTYSFTTRNNILYRIAFLVDETLNSISTSEVLIENVYQIVIEKVSDALEPFDNLVSKTIENIICAFFSNVNNSLIYICSDDQEKGKIRFSVFDRWYRNSSFNQFVTKIDTIISFDSEGINYNLYTSFLYHNDNPNIDYIVTTYNNIEKVLNSDK